MGKRAAILFLLVCFHCLTGIELFAQAPFFKKISFDIEKNGTKLFKIFQDRKGLIWLGTNLGICRYDGINFKYLDKDSSQVTAIGESNNGVLWIGHNNGVLEYAEGMTIKKIAPDSNMPGTRITDIVFDRENRLWFSTYGEGLYCYDHDTLSHFNTADGLTDNVVYDLFIADDNTIWAATDLGISVCELLKGRKQIAVVDEKKGLPDNIVRSIKKDEEGNIWIALQDKGVCYVDRLSGRIKVPNEVKDWKYGQVNDILPMKREVFIGTEENGIIEIHSGLPVLNKMIPAGKSRFNSIQQLLMDNNEQVWVVADNALSITNCNHFQTIEIPSQWQDPIKAITTNKKGTIWFANRKGLFEKQDNNSPVIQVSGVEKIDYSSIVCLYSDYNNIIWIGTYNNGLYRYDPVHQSLKQYSQADGITDNNIFSISGVGNEIWLGTLGGATKMDISSGKPVFKNFTRENGLSNNYVYNILVDDKNRKWFSTDGSGISELDSSGFHHHDTIPGLEKNIVYTSTQDIYGNIWFTGLNSGLFCFGKDGFSRYTIKKGLHDNEILNLVADSKGNLLLSHPDGLEIFNIRKESFTFYGAESGFENIRPQINAYCKTPKDAILIGATEKIIQYYPADARYSQLPQLVMNDVQVYFNSIGVTDHVKLAYNENHITFDYAGLWYTNPEAVNYQYRLKGYNKGWIKTRDHTITFPDLQPGKYTLFIRTSINDDYRYSPELTFSFTILRPFWKTAWFITAVLMVTGLLIFYFVRLRIKVIRLAEEKEKQKLSAQLALLKNQLNPHFLFNSFNTLINIIDKDKLTAMEYAGKLSDFYREILMIQDKEMVSVAEELHLLQNYVYLQQKRFGDNLRLQLNISEVHLRAGIPPLTLQLLIENALKHNIVTEDKQLSITIESAQSFLVVSNNVNLQETGVKSAGIGLKNIQQRIFLLTEREVKIIQNEHEFNVIIPLKYNNHASADN